MPDRFSPVSVLSATSRMKNDLVKLVGVDSLGMFVREIEILTSQLRTSSDQFEKQQFLAELISLFADHPRLRERFNAEINAQSLMRERINRSLSSLSNHWILSEKNLTESLDWISSAFEWELDQNTIAVLGKLDEESTRTVHLNLSGIETDEPESYTIKLSNLRVNWVQFSLIVGQTMVMGGEIAQSEKPNILILVGAILTMVAVLGDAMKKNISAQDASVFWGMIQACEANQLKQVTEEDILRETNVERKSYDLQPLTEVELHNSLRSLKNIKTIKRVRNKQKVWEMSESYITWD